MASGYRSRREAPHDMNGAAILLRSWHLCCPIMSSSRNTTPVTVAWQNLRALGRAIPAAERSAATSARHSRMVRRAGFTVALAAGIAALSFAAAQSASMTVAETGSTLIYPLFNESYQRGCPIRGDVKKNSSPPLRREMNVVACIQPNLSSGEAVWARRAFQTDQAS